MVNSFKQIKIGSIISAIVVGVNILISLIYTPIMIRLLGSSEYGLYNTVSSTISLLSILNLGFGSGYVRYYSIYKSKNDNESIYKLNGLYIVIFTIIGIIALICGLYLTSNLNIVFKNGLTSSEYKLASKLMLISTINLAISFPTSVFQTIINANERFIFLKIVSGIKLLIGPFITIPLLLSGYKSIAIVSVSFVLSVLIDIVFIYYVLSILKNKFIFKNFEKGLFKDIAIFTSFIAINIIVDQVNWNIDKLLLARFKGTFAVAVCSVAYSLYHYYQVFSTTVSSLFTPKIHNIVNENKNNTQESRKKLTNIFTKVGRIQFVILALVSSGLIFFGKEFIYFWAGKDYSESYYVALLIIIPATIPLIQNIGIEIQRAQNNHQFRSIVYSIIAIMNLIISIILIPKYGATGAAIGTAISLIIGNCIIMNIYYNKKCNIDIVYFWKEILKLTKGLIIPIIVGIVFINLNIDYSIIGLMIKIAIYSIIYAVSMWLLGLNKFEKDLILVPLKRISNK